MADNKPVTHGLHWLTLGLDGCWQCAHPDCYWHIGMFHHLTAQDFFNIYHAKLSEAEASVQP